MKEKSCLPRSGLVAFENYIAEIAKILFAYFLVGIFQFVKSCINTREFYTVGSNHKMNYFTVSVIVLFIQLILPWAEARPLDLQRLVHPGSLALESGLPLVTPNASRPSVSIGPRFRRFLEDHRSEYKPAMAAVVYKNLGYR